AANIETLPPGVRKPPTDLCAIIDKLANFVARNGGAFEAKVKAKNIGDSRFGFLLPWNEYHPYYQHKVSEFAAQIKAEGKEGSADVSQTATTTTASSSTATRSGSPKKLSQQDAEAVKFLEDQLKEMLDVAIEPVRPIDEQRKQALRAKAKAFLAAKSANAKVGAAMTDSSNVSDAKLPQSEIDKLAPEGQPLDIGPQKRSPLVGSAVPKTRGRSESPGLPLDNLTELPNDTTLEAQHRAANADVKVAVDTVDERRSRGSESTEGLTLDNLSEIPNCTSRLGAERSPGRRNESPGLTLDNLPEIPDDDDHEDDGKESVFWSPRRPGQPSSKGKKYFVVLILIFFQFLLLKIGIFKIWIRI
ncbi:hypothetical protein HK102_009150, partial [Quaeritorhiza haematococci]